MAFFDRTKITMGKDVFFVQQYPPFEGMRVLGEAQKVILPALAGIMAPSAEEPGKGKDMEAVLGAMLTLPQTVNGADMESLVKTVIKPELVSVKIGGKGDAVPLDEDAMTTLFTGRYFDLLMLVWKVLKVNFLDFTKLCALPSGIVSAIEGMTGAFRESSAETLKE